MSPPAPQPAPEAEARPLVVRLLAALGGLDLASADGRAGIGALLSEIERLSPGAIHRHAAGMDLRRLGWSQLPGSGNSPGFQAPLAQQAPHAFLAGEMRGPDGDERRSGLG